MAFDNIEATFVKVILIFDFFQIQMTVLTTRAKITKSVLMESIVMSASASPASVGVTAKPVSIS